MKKFQYKNNNMKRIILIFLGLFSLAYAQYSPTGAKTQFKNGLGLGSKDSSAFLANDSLAITIDRNNRLLWRNNGSNGTWNVVAKVGATDFIINQSGSNLSAQTAKFRITDTGWINNVLRTNKALLDSIQASGSGGAGVYSNNGTHVAQFGAGGGAGTTLYGGLNGTSASFNEQVRFGNTTTSDYYVRSGAVATSATGRRGLLLSDDATVDHKVYAGGNQTLGAWTESLNQLTIGTGLNGGGGGSERILFHSTVKGNMFAMDANGSRNWSYFPLTIQATSVPTVINSTNSNTNKIQLQDAGATLGFLGASGTNALVVSNSSAIPIVTVNNTTGALTANSFVKSGGTSSEFLKADGSVSTLSALTLGRGLTGGSYDGSSAVTARLDTTANYTWTGTNTWNETHRGFFNGDNYAWQLNSDGSGQIGYNNSTWSTTGVWSNFSATSASISGSGAPLTVSSTNSNDMKITIRDNTTIRGYIGANSTNAFMVRNSGGNDRLRITDGLGEVTAGGVYTATVGATNRDVFVDNTGLLGYVSSFRASKKNIQPLSNTSWLHQLNPVKFNYRIKDSLGRYTDSAYKELEYGLIAEEVEAINKEMVFYDVDSMGKHLRGVHYSKLIIPLLKEVQDQKKTITDLEARIARLEAIINKIKP